MLSGLFTSTLMQQAVRYEVIAAESHGIADIATVDRATTFSAYDGDQLMLAPYDTAREQQAIFQGAFSPPNETIPHVRPTCSSSQCTWPNYGSLAVCGDVANLTALGDQSLLERLGNATERRLGVLYNTSRATSEALGYGAAYFESVPLVFPIVIGLLDKPTNAFNKSVTDLMLSDSFIAYTDELLNNSATFDMSKVKYLEVALWWCTKTYSTEVTAGKAVTTEVSTMSQLKEPASSSLNMPWAMPFYPCYTFGTCNSTYGGQEARLEPPPGASSSDSYTIHIWTELTASALIAATMFDSVFMDRTRGVVSSNGGGIAKAFGLSILGDFMSASSPPPEMQMANTRALISNVARSTTNLVRQGNTRMSTNTTASFPLVNGTVFTQQSFISIHWEWTAMLAVQLVLTFIFLSLTMIATHRARMQVIKCSSLATLCALDKNTRGHVGGINDLDSLGKKAKMLGVRLERGSSGVALWLGTGRGTAGTTAS
ncbi:hypothetical protein B0T14DRAFT_534127 [Immersiella caudata]|uniref:Uncharacterized protein n=1 Tax=Immersiella caudata TaxID=314043 RepID=A0AA39XHQ7_9PEZI|nr:hypothetical protein B0T14DRAFT_534127 [Immersiella caudata]